MLLSTSYKYAQRLRGRDEKASEDTESAVGQGNVNTLKSVKKKKKLFKSEKTGIPLRHRDKLSLSSTSRLAGRASCLDKDSLHPRVGCWVEKPAQAAEE